MTISKLGAAAPSQISSSPSSAQAPSKLQGAAQQFQGLEQYQGAVDDLAQNLASDPSLRTPGQLHQEAHSALSELGLAGGAMQKLVQEAVSKANEYRLSSGDRWLGPIVPPEDSFSPGGGTTAV